MEGLFYAEIYTKDQINKQNIFIESLLQPALKYYIIHNMI